MLLRAFALGLATGLRSQTAMAALALVAQRDPEVVRSGSPAARLRTPRAALFTGTSALGEMVVDKLPIVPSRLTAPVLGGRILFGGLTGAANTPLAYRPWEGAVVAMLGAVAGNYGGYYGRAWLGKRTAWPDPAVGLVEDAIAVSTALAAARTRVS